MGITSLIPGFSQARLILVGLTFAGGFAAAEIYEHRVPWGLGPKLERLRDSLPRRDAERYTAGAKDQRARDQLVVDTSWRPALKECRASLKTASQQAGTAIDAERDASTRSSAAAYRLGRATCTGAPTNAKPSPRSSTAPSVGVRGTGDDLRDIVASGIGTTP